MCLLCLFFCLCTCYSLSHNKITDASTDRLLQLLSINPSIHTVRWAYSTCIHSDISTDGLTHKSFLILDLMIHWYLFSAFISRLFSNNIKDRTPFNKLKQFEIWWFGNMIIREELSLLLIIGRRYYNSASVGLILRLCTVQCCIYILYNVYIFRRIICFSCRLFFHGDNYPDVYILFLFDYFFLLESWSKYFYCSTTTPFYHYYEQKHQNVQYSLFMFTVYNDVILI